jgi:hypothetical protein
VVIYTGAPLNLERALDATQAHSLADANIIHRSPDDRSVFTLDTEVDVEGTRLPIAEPVQLVWELEALGGDDRMEAAGKLRQWLLTTD